MHHATIDQLSEVVVGRAPDALAAGVASHLGTGCARCGRLAAALQRLRRVGRDDAALAAPPGTSRAVKALAATAPRARRAIRMLLSFDSSLAPAPAGTRSAQRSGRHLVFYSQQFAIDLRMDCERSLRDLVVVGELVARDTGPLADVPAYLVCGGRVVSRATTGSLGEFHMECRPVAGLHLRLEVGEQDLIEIRLDRRRQGDCSPAAVLDTSGRPGGGR